LQEKVAHIQSAQTRVRFAPAPTGKMHLGNIRTALENYLYARKHNGTFVLRIEDTDQSRNVDPHAEHIIEHLKWLGLTHDEGPYFQSQRIAIYQEKLEELEKKEVIYRCFCTPEELETKRQRQIALKKPPRYDRTCFKLSPEEVAKKLEQKQPFAWRFKIDETQHISFHDIARGTLKFDLAHFSDFPITRQDGSFTFIFANAIDDWLMEITHILRGDDHLTNTVNQAALLKSFNAPEPHYWHLPILCNKDGKKLSKRDFGFSLEDLKHAGYLPEAIVNYLGVIGGSVADEIMTLEELVRVLPETPSSTSHIKYDVEKLNWVNRKWIERMTPQELVASCTIFLATAYDLYGIPHESLERLVALVQTDLTTLKDIIGATRFYFEQPTISEPIEQDIRTIISKNLVHIDSPRDFLVDIKTAAREHNIAPSIMFQTIRLLLTVSRTGPSVQGLMEVLGTQKSRARLTQQNDSANSVAK
jgi:nondiscriminating glutamyl-tRNA synthetase